MRNEKEIEHASIKYYGRIAESKKEDSKFLNNQAISLQNKARLIQERSDRIKKYEEIHDLYWRSVHANPLRDQGWRNIAAVNRDILHELLNISDMKKLDPEQICRNLPDEKKEYAEKLYDEASECLKIGSRFAPGNLGFYYVYADINCSLALIRKDETAAELLEEAKNKLGFALLLEKNNGAVDLAEKYLSFCADQLIKDEETKKMMNDISGYNIERTVKYQS